MSCNSDHIKICVISLEWFCCERGVLNQIIAVDGILTRACEPELKWHSSSHYGNTRFHELHHQLMIILVYSIQGVLVCHPISQGQIVNTQYYSRFSITTCVVQLGRSVQNLKMGTFLHLGVGCAAVPTLFWPQSMIDYDLIPKLR
jgi:hypothetical protein